jgi:hypothetical protein
VIVLDENIIASQCDQLRDWQIPFRQIGSDRRARGWMMSKRSSRYSINSPWLPSSVAIQAFTSVYAVIHATVWLSSPFAKTKRRDMSADFCDTPSSTRGPIGWARRESKSSGDHHLEPRHRPGASDGMVFKAPLIALAPPNERNPKAGVQKFLQSRESAAWRAPM